MDEWSPRRLGWIGLALLAVSVLWGLFFFGVGVAALITEPAEEDPLAGAMQGIMGWVSIGFALAGGTAAGIGGLGFLREAARRAQAASGRET